MSGPSNWRLFGVDEGRGGSKPMSGGFGFLNTKRRLGARFSGIGWCRKWMVWCEAEDPVLEMELLPQARKTAGNVGRMSGK